jgi:hypothetical protein
MSAKSVSEEIVGTENQRRHRVAAG